MRWHVCFSEWHFAPDSLLQDLRLWSGIQMAAWPGRSWRSVVSYSVILLVNNTVLIDVAAMEKINKQKAELLYSYIDSSKFYMYVIGQHTF